MKYAVLAITAVLVVGPGLQASPTRSALSLSKNASSYTSAGLSKRQVVYVDKAELARLHPSWQALSDMRAVLSKAGKAHPPSRTELAAKSAMKASVALDEFQARRLEALRVRREAMKAQKLLSSEADWKADARGIEEVAAAEAKSVDEQHTADLVNARIKAGAAKAIANAAAKDKSGMDSTAAKEIEKGASDRVATLGNADEAQKDQIMAVASEKIKALKDAAEGRVEEQVRTYEAEQQKQIGSSVALARDEIAKELGPDAMAIAESRLAQTPTGAASVKSDISELRLAVAALQAQIGKDVDAAVRDVAAKRGVDVTSRRDSAVRDETRTFSVLIKKRGWNAYGPVMGGMGSS